MHFDDGPIVLWQREKQATVLRLAFIEDFLEWTCCAPTRRAHSHSTSSQSSRSFRGLKRIYLRHNEDAEANDMIHMGSDHRCVMATFTIAMPGKNNHYKNTKGKHDMIKHERCVQTGKTLKLRSLSSKKRYQDHRFFFKKKKTAATKKAAAQAESEDVKAQVEKENAAAAAGENCDNAKAKTEEVERMCTGSMMNCSVETANEAGGRHRGRPVLRTVSEDEDHIVFHNDHIEHDMNDGPNETEKTEAESKGIQSTSTETTPKIAVQTAGETGEEHSDRSTVNEEADRIVGDGHPPRTVPPSGR